MDYKINSRNHALKIIPNILNNENKYSKTYKKRMHLTY